MSGRTAGRRTTAAPRSVASPVARAARPAGRGRCWAAPRRRAATSSTVTFQPDQIAWTAPEIANTLRGQYAWLGQEATAQPYKTLDTYYRDQVMWSRIEPTRGSYDWTWFDAGLADAEARGGTFGFRVMAWCPQLLARRDPVLAADAGRHARSRTGTAPASSTPGTT